jgi:hypothetical protein
MELTRLTLWPLNSLNQASSLAGHGAPTGGQPRLVFERQILHAIESGEPPLAEEVLDLLLAPLGRLRAEYQGAIPRIERLIVELERMRLALSSEAVPPPPVAPAAHRPPPAAPRAQETPSETRVDVRGDFSRILDLQEQLTRMVGVANVRVTHLSGEGATLIVELAPPAPQ